jgi:hypothetical protein
MEEHGGLVVPQNQAWWDRAIRIGLGFVLFGLGLSGVFAEPVGGLLRVASLLPFALGGFGWCPIYQALGFSTRRRSSQPAYDSPVRPLAKSHHLG